MDPLHQRILETRLHLTQLEIENWQTNSFLHWHWWGLIIVFTLPWFLWWRLVRKDELPWIISYALSLALLMVDLALVNLGLYAYPHRIQPIWSGLVIGDITLPPIVFSLIYQSRRDWKGYLLYSVIAVAVFSFIGEPMLEWVGLYELYHWSFLYSFPMYLAMNIPIKLVLDRMKKASQQ
ncbi:MAG: hypothetical protein HPY50_04790 [Firmicutes bacterium]|nr:hypothetical protein [Bacillota bacterium]